MFLAFTGEFSGRKNGEMSQDHVSVSPLGKAGCKELCIELSAEEGSQQLRETTWAHTCRHSVLYQVRRLRGVDGTCFLGLHAGLVSLKRL